MDEVVEAQSTTSWVATTCLEEVAKAGIHALLARNAALGDGVGRDVGDKCVLPLEGGVEEDVADALDNRCLLALPHEDHLEQAAVAFAEVENIAEHFINKLFDLALPYDGWVGVSEWADEQRLDRIQVAEVLLLLVDQFMNDAVIQVSDTGICAGD